MSLTRRLARQERQRQPGDRGGLPPGAGLSVSIRASPRAPGSWV